MNNLSFPLFYLTVVRKFPTCLRVTEPTFSSYPLSKKNLKIPENQIKSLAITQIKHIICKVVEKVHLLLTFKDFLMVKVHPEKQAILGWFSFLPKIR